MEYSIISHMRIKEPRKLWRSPATVVIPSYIRNPHRPGQIATFPWRILALSRRRGSWTSWSLSPDANHDIISIPTVLIACSFLTIVPMPEYLPVYLTVSVSLPTHHFYSLWLVCWYIVLQTSRKLLGELPVFFEGLRQGSLRRGQRGFNFLLKGTILLVQCSRKTFVSRNHHHLCMLCPVPRTIVRFLSLKTPESVDGWKLRVMSLSNWDDKTTGHWEAVVTFG